MRKNATLFISERGAKAEGAAAINARKAAQFQIEWTRRGDDAGYIVSLFNAAGSFIGLI